MGLPAIRGNRRAYGSPYSATHDRFLATAYPRANGGTQTTSDCATQGCVSVDG
jgi:hypothetical protein